MRRWLVWGVTWAIVGSGVAWGAVANVTWSAPRALVANGDTGSYGVGLAGDGEALAAWAGRFGVFAAAAPPGKPFGAVQQLARTGDSVLLAVDRDGDAAVAWTEGDTPRRPGRLFIAYRRRGRSFVAARRIARDAGSFAMGMDASGDVMLVWQSEKRNAQPAGIAATVRRANGSVGAPQEIADTSEVYAPEVAVDGRGDAVAVWQSGPLQSSAIEAATRRAGHPFGTAFAIAPGRLEGLDPNVGIDGRGVALVAWDRTYEPPAGIPGHVEVGVVRVGRSGISRVTSLAGGPHGSLFEVDPEPQVAVDGRGDAAILWAVEPNSPAGNDAIEVARGSIATGFRPVMTLGHSDLDQPPEVGISSSGAVIAAWDDLEGRNRAIVSSGPKASFGASDPLSSRNRGAAGPVVAIDGSTAVAIWQDLGPAPNAAQQPPNSPLLYSTASIG